VSQVKPAWADRYFGALVASVLVLAALGLSRAGRLGVVGLVMILVFWTKPLARVAGIRTTPKLNEKSNTKLVASIFSSWLSPPDLVVSAQMEQVPSLNLYIARPGLRYATPMGPVADPTMADWRRATERMGAATPQKDLMPLVKDLPVGHHVLLVCPRVFTTSRALPWFRYMDHRCRDWREALSADPSFQLLAGPAPPLETGQPGTSMFGMLFLKVAP
jgi:hypothetical protein